MNQSTCSFELTPPSNNPLTNRIFLQALARSAPEHSFLWVTSFPGDPQDARRPDWRGHGIRVDRLASASCDAPGLIPPPAENTYYTVSSFRPDDFGTLTRSKSLFDRLLVLVIDDVGSGLGAKIPWSVLRGRPQPSFVFETSPGNCQIGYFLETPIADRETAEELITGSIDVLADGDDPGMNSVTRLVRLPQGVNGKSKYKDGEDSKNPDFICKVLHWNPDRRYQPEILAEYFGFRIGLSHLSRSALTLLGIDPATVRTSTHRLANTLSNPTADPWYPLVAAGLGLRESPRAKGGEQWVDVHCPNEAEHTGGDPSGAGYLIGNEHGGQGFECHHGHCQHLTFVDIRSHLVNSESVPEDVRATAVDLYALECFPQAPSADPGEPVVRAEIDTQGLYRVEIVDEDPLPQVPPSAPSGIQTEDLGPSNTAYEELLADAYRLPPGQSKDLSSFLDRLAWAHRDLGGTAYEDIVEAARIATSYKKSSILEELKPRERQIAAQRRQYALTKRSVTVDSRDPRDPPYVDAWPDAAMNDEGVEDGRVGRKTARNVEYMLTQAQASVRLNAMTQSLEFGGSFERIPWSQNGGNEMITLIHEWCMMTGLEAMQRSEAFEKIKLVARASTYHPFEEFLNTLFWDGQDRLRCLGGLYDTIPVPQGSETHRDLVLSRWFYSLIAAARNLHQGRAGLQPRGVLVFTGKQYSGKSTWLMRLFEDLFPNSIKCFLAGAHFSGTADSKLELLSHLLVELAELETTIDRVRAGELKAFLSNPSDMIRRPYAMVHDDLERRTVFAGTVNEEQFLRDPTGSTRFWTIKLAGRVKLDATRVLDLPQIWAQIDAECLYAWQGLRPAPVDRKGIAPVAPWLLHPEEMQAVQTRNEEKHSVESNVDVWLSDQFDWDLPESKYDQKMTMSQILSEFAGTVGTRVHASVVKRALESRTKQTRPRTGGGSRNRYWLLPPRRVALEADVIDAVTGQKKPWGDSAGPKRFGKPGDLITKH